MSKPENLYASSPDDELHIQHYLSTNCFGDHYTWTGIDVPTREMLTFGARRARWMRTAGLGPSRREPLATTARGSSMF